MIIEQVYLNCLSQASYLIGSGDRGAVIDPRRDVAEILEKAKRQGLRIEWVLETHFHADFVSGHRELAAKTGAKLGFGQGANPSYPVHHLEDGEEITLGSLAIRVIATPGHTPESVCYLVIDRTRGDSRGPWGGRPLAVMTGDTLFVGGVGRPDLMGSDQPAEVMASTLFDSLHDKLMKLPDDVVVYPGHGPGSSCGANLGPETQSTIGKERVSNYAILIPTREEFVKVISSNISPPPRYFHVDARLNRQGPGTLDDVLSRLESLTPDEVDRHLKGAGVVLDVRDAKDFGAGHIPGSINIGLGGRFASWVGTVLDHVHPVVIVTPKGRHDEAAMRLARVGYENVSGWLEGGIDAWKQSGRSLATLAQIDVQDLKRKLAVGELRVIDVRALSEWEAGRIEGAVHRPLPDIGEDPSTCFPKSEGPWAIVCAGGYRSSIASSLFMRAGVKAPLLNVIGGMNAWFEAGLPSVVEVR